MKQTKHTSKSSKATPKTAANHPSFEPAKTVQEITDDFVKKQAKDWKFNGDNSYLNDFANVARMICSQYRTWSVNDLLAMTRSLDTPAQAIMSLHNDWIEALKAHGRLTVVSGVYDFPQYTFR